tara:strand:+ start:498 stop:710 length:213 start_codon:yes stop_codon:yes gene_type:complete
MQGLGDVVNGAVRMISEMISKTDKAVESGFLDGVKISIEEMEKLKSANDDAKAKREELFKLINNADRNTK